MNLLVTGANGFIGARLVSFLKKGSFNLTTVVRRAISGSADNALIINLDSTTDWAPIVSNIDVVIHTAAKVHAMSGDVDGSLASYREMNTYGTLKLAEQSAAAGVKRFIFISSVKVNGEQTGPASPYSANDPSGPVDPYGISKYEAELGLLEIASKTTMEVVIIRPPLVYGPQVKGNFASMIKLVGKGVPLPLGAIHNKRSLVGIDNLVDLIIHCIDHPAAANQIFLAGDGEDLSTTELLRGVGKAMGKPARLIPVPVGFLYFGAILLGKKAMAQRLLGSLQVDISKTCELLDWKPPYTVEEGLKRCFERSE
ncbi:SDR family oxidoreductase [Stutzerimonas stutzeri]|uniref:UDP-glucose 4-epimerase family protein n=1 Tax=Stutzerimonas stutzeri TaxID=316 RepID=UPI0031D036F2